MCVYIFHQNSWNVIKYCVHTGSHSTCLTISLSILIFCVPSLITDVALTGTRSVIHPKVRIIAEAGPIIIGENNLIEERTQIINRSAFRSSLNYSPLQLFVRRLMLVLHYRLPKGDKESQNQTVMIIGNNNVFEVGCCILYTMAWAIFFFKHWLCNRIPCSFSPLYRSIALLPWWHLSDTEALKIGDNNILEAKGESLNCSDDEFV